MNTSSRVPGMTRNSGWQVIDAEIAARRLEQRPLVAAGLVTTEKERAALAGPWLDVSEHRHPRHGHSAGRTSYGRHSQTFPHAYRAEGPGQRAVATPVAA